MEANNSCCECPPQLRDHCELRAVYNLIDLSPKFFTTNITCAILLSLDGERGVTWTSFFCLRHVLQNGLCPTLVRRESWERLRVDFLGSVLCLFAFQLKFLGVEIIL